MSIRVRVREASRMCLFVVLVSVLIVSIVGFRGTADKKVMRKFKARIVENMAYREALIVEKTPAENVIHKRILVMVTDDTKIGSDTTNVDLEDLATGTTILIKGDPRIEKTGDSEIIIVEAHTIRPLFH